jgi:hypothetical protein
LLPSPIPLPYIERFFYTPEISENNFIVKKNKLNLFSVFSGNKFFR